MMSLQQQRAEERQAWVDHLMPQLLDIADTLRDSNLEPGDVNFKLMVIPCSN